MKHANLDALLEAVRAEVIRASSLHGPFSSARHGHSVIEEEYDEFWDEIKADDIDKARVEVTRLAAMCVRFLMDVK